MSLVIAPEVVQSSAMDCGPAALKCLLEGFGIAASYGRLREACQTDVDGTSIDTLEDVACELGLDAEQIMVPVDQVLSTFTAALPAIAVVSLPNAATHFVAAWRRHGPLVQIMDPAIGRRWTTRSGFLRELYVHAHPVPESAWIAWARSDEGLGSLRARLLDLGVDRGQTGRLLASVLDLPGWRPTAGLEASARLVASLVSARGLARGREAARAVRLFADEVSSGERPGQETIPARYWTVRAAPIEGDEPQLLLRGAVLVRVRGRRRASSAREDVRGGPAGTDSRSPELAAAIEEPPARPFLYAWRLVKADGMRAPALLGAALAVSSAGLVIEAIILRAVLEVPFDLPVAGHRAAALGAILAFFALLLVIDVPIATSSLRIGRRLECRLRLAFLAKVPRLPDRYFRSRLVSDMAERVHAIHQVRALPDLCAQFARAAFELVLTAAAMVWLAPETAPLAIAAALLALVVPLATQPVLAERDLRVRTHGGALGRFYLDALLGLAPIRAHAAERAVSREHEGLLVEWARAGYRLQRVVVAVEGLQLVLGFGLAAWLLFDQLVRGANGGTALLLAYWALGFPVIGQEIASLAGQYPGQRNLLLRLMEPLGSPEEAIATGSDAATHARAGGVQLDFDQVTVRAAGHIILESLDLHIRSGEHVAIVGASGAGKSTLVGLLLGWHRPASGRVLAGDEVLDAGRLDRLRQETAWVDPSVRLWNEPLLDNLTYGNPDAAVASTDRTLDFAELKPLVGSLPHGLQSPIGEGGALVSGGEGQRIRFARALGRPAARLVILDEPFTGLERSRRQALTSRARDCWRDATLLCVTHDLEDAAGFDRVLVVQRGRVVEDGRPRDLAARPDSLYRGLLDAERTLRQQIDRSASWRRMELRDGRLVGATVQSAGEPELLRVVGHGAHR